KSRIDNTPDKPRTDKQQSETEIVECRAVTEVDQAVEPATVIDGEAIVAAVAVESDGDVIDHLRECQRDHYEIDAARAQTERADDKGVERRSPNRDRPLNEAGTDAFLGQNPDRITANSQIGGVAEAHH